MMTPSGLQSANIVSTSAKQATPESAAVSSAPGNGSAIAVNSADVAPLIAATCLLPIKPAPTSASLTGCGVVRLLTFVSRSLSAFTGLTEYLFENADILAKTSFEIAIAGMIDTFERDHAIIAIGAQRIGHRLKLVRQLSLQHRAHFQPGTR